MNPKEYVVRIVKPKNKPALPKAALLNMKSRKNKIFLKRSLNILAGSGVGFAAGIVVYLMLKIIGINFGGLESSVIIGLPAILGILTSFVIC